MNLKPSQVFLSAAVLLTPLLASAQPTAHYVAGVEGIKGASLPPPGVYLRDYNVFYFSDRYNGPGGDEFAPANPDAFIYANVPRLIWITKAQVLGGFIGVDALLPLQYTDLEITTPGGPFKDDVFGVGDVFAEVTWSRHWKQVDLSLGYGIWAPTGEFEAPPSAEAGNGYWGHMLTAGATVFFDQGKRWALTALSRYEFNHEQEDTDVTKGQAYTLEWGLSYGVTKTLDVGLVGYYQQQVTEDDGPNATDDLDSVAAIGGEVSYFHVPFKLNAAVRYLYEFSAENRLQGHTIALVLTKVF